MLLTSDQYAIYKTTRGEMCNILQIEMYVWVCVFNTNFFLRFLF